MRGVERDLQLSQPLSCSLVKFKVKQAVRDAVAARKAYTRYLNRTFLLHDFDVQPDNHAWHKAVAEVQKIFPGTEAWLLSCSAAEGGHGRWVRYGGGSYYPGYEYTDAVGNWLQFRWSTFKGMFRHALEYAQARGYIIPEHLRDSGHVRAWLSPLATAMAGGWARYTGNDASHWSASWSSGC